MARGRMINQRLGKSKKYSKLKSDRSRVLYVLMYTHADQEGKFTGDPEDVKIECCPYLKYSPQKIAESIVDLHNVDLLNLYEVDDRCWVQFVDFEDNQPGLRKDREAPSVIPDPPNPDKLRSKSGATPALYLSLSLSLSKFNIRSMEKKKYDIEFSFEERKFLGIVEKDIEGWKEAFPRVNISGEISRAREWLLSNPGKRKKNYRRFLTNWFGRSQEKGGSSDWDERVGISEKKKTPLEIERSRKIEDYRIERVKKYQQQTTKTINDENEDEYEKIQSKIRTEVAEYSRKLDKKGEE